MAKKSFVPLDREVVLDKVLGNPDLKHLECRLLIYCIVRANFKNNLVTDKFGKETLINRGSFCTSSEIIMKDLRISDWRTYDTAREKLKDKGYLNFFSDNGGTYFHVKNYNDYVEMPIPVPPVKLQKHLLDKSSTRTSKNTEQIKIYTAGNAPSPLSIKNVPTLHPRAASMENENVDEDLTTPSGAVESQHNIPSLTDQRIDKNSDYYKLLETMYGNTVDVWGELNKLFKIIKYKKLKINNLESYLESSLRKKSEANTIKALAFNLKEKGKKDERPN